MYLGTNWHELCASLPLCGKRVCVRVANAGCLRELQPSVTSWDSDPVSERKTRVCQAARQVLKPHPVPRPWAPRPQVAFCVDAVKRHNMLMVLAGETLAPKHHRLLHLVEKQSEKGSAKFYSCYADEGFNLTVIRLAGSVNPVDLALTVLRKYYVLCSATRRWL